MEYVQYDMRLLSYLWVIEYHRNSRLDRLRDIARLIGRVETKSLVKLINIQCHRNIVPLLQLLKEKKHTFLAIDISYLRTIWFSILLLSQLS